MKETKLRLDNYEIQDKINSIARNALDKIKMYPITDK